MVMSDKVAKEQLDFETVYFAQVRANNQITIPKECMTDKNLKPGDVIAMAILKIVDSKITWKQITARLGGE